MHACIFLNSSAFTSNPDGDITGSGSEGQREGEKKNMLRVSHLMVATVVARQILELHNVWSA